MNRTTLGPSVAGQFKWFPLMNPSRTKSGQYVIHSPVKINPQQNIQVMRMITKLILIFTTSDTYNCENCLKASKENVCVDIRGLKG